MKFLIKTVIVGIIVIILGLYLGLNIYGKALVANMASRVLHTDVKITEVKFVPKMLALQLYKVNIPKWRITFPKGIIHLVPLKLHLQGLEIMRGLELLEDKLSLQVQAKGLFSRSRIWQLNMTFKSVDLVDLSSTWPEVLSYGFSSGTLDGIINGTCSDEKDCNFYGLLHFYNMVYNGSTPPMSIGGVGESITQKTNELLGIPIEEIIEFIKAHNGSIDLDFSYRGSLNELNNPFRYRPGPKIIRALSAYLIKKIS